MNNEINNTEKLLNALLPICEVKQGVESISKDGEKYRYDLYIMRYSSVFNSVANLFSKAAADNGNKYSNQFIYNAEYSFHYDRPTFKGEKNGKITFSKLVKL